MRFHSNRYSSGIPSDMSDKEEELKDNPDVDTGFSSPHQDVDTGFSSPPIQVLRFYQDLIARLYEV